MMLKGWIWVQQIPTIVESWRGRQLKGTHVSGASLLSKRQAAALGFRLKPYGDDVKGIDLGTTNSDVSAVEGKLKGTLVSGASLLSKRQAVALGFRLKPHGDDVEGIDLGTTNSDVSAVEGKLLKVWGSIYDRSVHVLIATGSSYNIIRPQLAHELQLLIQKSAVGDESRLRSEGICKSVSLTIQGYQFSADLHLLPIQRDGIDVVLGMEWVRKLGCVEFDFEKMTVNLATGDSKVRLFSLA